MLGAGCWGSGGGQLVVREARYARTLGPMVPTLFVCFPDTHTRTGRLRNWVLGLQRRLHEAFLPDPRDVTPDYWDWLRWRLSQVGVGVGVWGAVGWGGGACVEEREPGSWKEGREGLGACVKAGCCFEGRFWAAALEFLHNTSRTPGAAAGSGPRPSPPES